MAKIRMSIETTKLAACQLPEVSASYQLKQFQDFAIEKSADLLVEAYRNTTDWEDGDGIEVAIAELTSVVNGEYGELLADASLAIVDSDDTLISEIICVLSEETPLILFLYTAPSVKRMGIAAELLRTCANQLMQAGHSRVELYVTENNPAIHLYEKLGFKPL